MRILVTGVTGQVGRDLLGALAPLGEVTGLNRSQLDLGSPDSIRAAMRRFEPELIFNPAAYTAVDLAESEPDAAMQVNGVAPGVIAEEALRLGARLVHYSTDYVFDGRKAEPYREDDAVAPLGVYGRTKLAGERAIAAVGCRHLVLRTSWVYSLHGRNFLTTMHRLARERDELRVVDDQHGAPTSSAEIARASASLVARWLDDGAGSAASRPVADGVYHMTCAGSTTWCGFARAIVARLPDVALALGAPAPERIPKVTPITTADFPTPARRPANSVLDNAKLQATFGVALGSWQGALDALLRAARPGA